MKAMGLDIQGRRGLTKLRMHERRAMYAFCFTAIKRLAGAGHVLAPNTIRIPINDGWCLTVPGIKLSEWEFIALAFFVAKIL